MYYSILRKSHIITFCVDDAYYTSGLTKNELPVYSLITPLKIPQYRYLDFRGRDIII